MGKKHVTPEEDKYLFERHIVFHKDYSDYWRDYWKGKSTRKYKHFKPLTKKEREEARRHYTVIKVRGQTKIVARIPKGMAGAGRFAKVSK